VRAVSRSGVREGAVNMGVQLSSFPVHTSLSSFPDSSWSHRATAVSGPVLAEVLACGKTPCWKAGMAGLAARAGQRDPALGCRLSKRAVNRSQTSRGARESC